ncbi:Uncharacterized OsmC-related protein [Amphibacillus marinus]|uniref:Uncharacterized OsmC-related protein n=1 Tax=Amphibacillus marinus TaxID=872970 RepID=A0A1H8MGQ9_9BACI|nr:OsmC family protein [Amphibacillus marinus]SEO16346.1 Uncharacterized OsmC-related protein [Amphibacillus marinus]
MIVLKKDKHSDYQAINDNGTVSIGRSSQSNQDGFSPVDYLCSSVALCMGLNIDSITERDNLDISSYTIEVSATKAVDARPSRMEKLDVKVELIGNIDDKTRSKVIKSAKRGCTIGNTLEHGVPINLV